MSNSVCSDERVTAHVEPFNRILDGMLLRRRVLLKLLYALITSKAGQPGCGGLSIGSKKALIQAVAFALLGLISLERVSC
jgi:hypothetical protein